MSIDINLLKTSVEELFGLTLSDEAISKLDAFKDAVVTTNEKFNLTSIVNEPDFTVKHLVDSLAAAPLLPQNGKVLDIGTGAGFPSFPLAVAKEDAVLYALDATSKKTSFLDETSKNLGVKNLVALTGRAEELKKRGYFDCALARAVAPLNILLEIALPLLKTGGIFVAYKADNSELNASENALATLHGKFRSQSAFKLPNGDSRTLLVFEKTGETPPRYPRQFGQIKKKPL